MPNILLYLYGKPDIDFEDICAYFRNLGIQKITYEGNIYANSSDSDKEAIAYSFAGARVINDKGMVMSPFPQEVVYEKKRLNKNYKKPTGILYDGFEVSKIYHKLIEEDLRFDRVNIVITEDLLGTKGYDKHYHARVIIFSYPVVISLPGLVLAPARERNYYLQRMVGEIIGRYEVEGCGNFLTLGDKRVNECLKGYILQAIFYHEKGHPFCNDKDCRLFDAHWQKDMIHAQIVSGKLCDRHAEELRKFL